MASCYNRNASEYQALQNKFTSPIIVDSLIDKWQKTNKSDAIPTVSQVQAYLGQEKTMLNLKKKEFAKSLLANLVRKKVISKFKDSYYVNNSNNNTWEMDPAILDFNKRQVKRWLSLWNLPEDTISLVKTDKSYKVVVNDDLFTKQDLISQDSTANNTHMLDIIQHMSSMFPQLNVEVVSVKDAKTYYDELPDSQKAKVPFSQVNSYYHRGSVKLIEGRVTTEIAVEEMLHPLVEAIKNTNSTLYSGILKEAKVNFPVLYQQIVSEYSDKAGFNDLERDMELITQALSRHFKKEYESTPTKSWTDKVKDILKFFIDIIKDLKASYVGNALNVKPNMISATTSLTDLAKLLNTKDLQFTFEKSDQLSPTVKYSLTPQKQSILNEHLGQANEIQASVINNLFHSSIKSEQTFEEFSATGMTGTNTPLVVLDKATHTYVNIETGEVYGSATTKIKGSLKDEEGNYEFNRLLGNDYDTILEGLAQYLTFDELPAMEILQKEEAEKAYNALQNFLYGLRADGSVIISQVVVADEDTQTAGTIDLLRVKPDGSLQVIDLKTSKNSIFGEGYENKAYPVNDGSVFYDSSLSNNDQIKLSTKTQHGIQVNLYRRMLENMGYKLDSNSFTYHILVDVEGMNKEQKFLGKFEVEGITNHPESANKSYVDQIVPTGVDETYLDKILNQYSVAGVNNPVNEPGFLNAEESLPQSDELPIEAYRSILSGLRNYSESLLTRQKAIEQIRNRAKLNESTENQLKMIESTVSSIAIAQIEGKVDIVYEKILKESVAQLEEFESYITDPKNFNKSEFINTVINFQDFINTFYGLVHLDKSEGLNLRQLALKEKLQTKLDEVNGVKSGKKVIKRGLIDEAIDNFVIELVRTNSNRDFTEVELKQLIKQANDIGAWGYQTGDLATSGDTLLALMDKLYKNKKMLVLDKVEERNNEIRRVATKLEYLSPGGKVDYSFMLVKDKDGNFTGRYVQEIGYNYYRQKHELSSQLRNADGSYKEYVKKSNLEDYTPKELEYNKELFKAKREYRTFMQPEVMKNKKAVDGDYHRYTDEFQKEREKYQTFKPVGARGQWVKKRSVSTKDYQKFLVKYYNTVEVDFAVYDNDGNFSGHTNKDTLQVPKNKYVEVRPISGKSEDMRDPQYVKLINPSISNSLAVAQKEFYELYVKYFEDELLSKLPASQKTAMLGKVPLVKDTFYNDLKKQPNVVASLWAKTKTNAQQFWNDTSEGVAPIVDEFGDPINTLPMFYVGNPRSEKALKSIEEEILSLHEQKRLGTITPESYNTKLKEAQGIKSRILAQPALNEISTDIADSLLKFSAMAENYEIMGELEDTYKAMLKVIEDRTYASKEKGEANIVKKAKKWMNMVYYNNDDMTKTKVDKIANALINTTSLAYVGFNVFGNVNNYAMGRINNYIEVAGGRFYDRKAYIRAELEFNKRALPDIMKKLAHPSTRADYMGGQGKYEEYIPGSKYEALVNHFRMMDDKAEVRELGQTKGKESITSKVMSWGYLLQDGAEYNVQTKTGMAVLMTQMIKNSTTGEELSLFDAYQFNEVTGEVTLKDGFDTYTNAINNKETQWTDESRYTVRNYIREVNKQIHGNYAADDRMVLQSRWYGKLAAQFHKWVAPAVKARFRPEYFDENLGWLEGRYLTFYSFMAYTAKNLKDIHQIGKKYKEFNGPKGQQKLQNVYRTLGELGFMLSSFAMAGILESLWDDDDDDKATTRKRLENALIYQMNRQGKELSLFLPTNLEDMYMMVKSPIASVRTLGELGQAIELSYQTPVSYLLSSEEEFYANKDYVYQRGTRKGQVKLKKEWMDVIPLLYTINRWQAYDTQKDFFIK